MSTAAASSLQQAPPPAAPRLEPPRLRHAHFEDYPQIAQLETANDLQSQPQADWRSVWLDNPLWPELSQRWPIGWVLEDSNGQIVGSVMNVPSRYMLDGRQLICANGRAWVAAPQYRGFALILMDEYFNQETADIFVNTTVGPMALGILSELASRVPLGDWQSISYWITHYRGFARQVLKKQNIPLAFLLAPPAAAALRLRDALLAKSFPPAPSNIRVEQICNFDASFDEFWTQLVALNPHKLLALRDRAALAWHFAIPLRRGRLRIFTALRRGKLCAYCIVKRHDQPGGFRRMRLVDYQSIDPDADLLPLLLRAAITASSAEAIDIFDHVGVGLPKMRALDDLAPRRHAMGNWPFYCRSNDPALSAQLSRPEIWDPSSFDGDASFE